MKPTVDYSLYLVTSSDLLPKGYTLEHQVEEALKNGTTLVQLREKDITTRDFIDLARKIHAITQKYNVPLIINDRVDVALAIGAEGIHVGQDDMHVTDVRRLVGPDKIVGLSVSYPEEIDECCTFEEGVLDYIGVGLVYETFTKKTTKTPMGPVGLRKLIQKLPKSIKNVGIGGINYENCGRSMLQSHGVMDGIAVVSNIIATTEAGKASKALADLMNLDTSFISDTDSQPLDVNPFVHHVTNKVAVNFSANVTLACKGSPIMSESTEEYEELAQIPHSVLIMNTGNGNGEAAFAAMKTYSKYKRPIVFDPVGYSASKSRKLFNDQLLQSGYTTVIKGNASEIVSLAGLTTEAMRGVDSASYSTEILIEAAKKLAFEFRCVVVCTGEVDVVADGIMGGKYVPQGEQRVTLIKGGSPIMADITASGCSLGSVIGCFLGRNETNPYESAVQGTALYKAAGKKAAERATGSGTFMSLLVDELYNYARNDAKWDVEIETLA